MTNSFSYSFMATAAMYISIAPATNNGSTIICGTFAFELSVWSMKLTLRGARRAKTLSERRHFFLVGDWNNPERKGDKPSRDAQRGSSPGSTQVSRLGKRENAHPLCGSAGCDLRIPREVLCPGIKTCTFTTSVRKRWMWTLRTPVGSKSGRMIDSRKMLMALYPICGSMECDLFMYPKMIRLDSKTHVCKNGPNTPRHRPLKVMAMYLV